jgi:hypothetical protein
MFLLLSGTCAAGMSCMLTKVHTKAFTVLYTVLMSQACDCSMWSFKRTDQVSAGDGPRKFTLTGNQDSPVSFILLNDRFGSISTCRLVLGDILR